MKVEEVDGKSDEIVLKRINLGSNGKELAQGEEDSAFTPDFDRLPVKFNFKEMPSQAGSASFPLDGSCGSEDDGLFLSPTIGSRPSGTSSDAHKHSMSVKYYMKLLLKSAEDGVKYFNVNEIYLHRSELPHISSADDSGL